MAYKYGTLKSSMKGILSKGDLKELQGFTRTEQAIVDALDYKIRELKKSAINKGHASARGNEKSNTLLASIDVGAPISNGNIITVSFGTGGKVGGYLDQGTKPSTKNPSPEMIKSIGSWLSGITKLTNKSKKKGGKKSLAWAIAKSILKKGIIKRYGHKGSKWYTDVAGVNNEKLEKYLTKKIGEAIGRDVEVKVTTDTQKMLNGNYSK